MYFSFGVEYLEYSAEMTMQIPEKTERLNWKKINIQSNIDKLLQITTGMQFFIQIICLFDNYNSNYSEKQLLCLMTGNRFKIGCANTTTSQNFHKLQFSPSVHSNILESHKISTIESRYNIKTFDRFPFEFNHLVARLIRLHT